MERKTQRAEIVNFRDLGWYLLLRWRLPVIIGLLAGVLLGAFQAFSEVNRVNALNRRILEEQASAGNETEADPGIEKTSPDAAPLSAESIAVTQEDRINFYQRILELRRKMEREFGAVVPDSPYMSLDPADVVSVRMPVLLRVPNDHVPGTVFQLILNYTTALKEESGMGAAAQALGMEPGQVLELFSVLDTLTSDCPDVGIASFTVRAYGRTEKEAKVILDAVKDRIVEKKQSAEELIGPHELEFGETVYTRGKDTDLYNGQIWYLNALISAQNDSVSYTDALAAAMGSSAAPSAVVPSQTVSVKRAAMKAGCSWLIIGFLAAALFSWLMILLGYLFGAKPVTKEQLLGACPGAVELGAFRRGIASLYRGSSAADRYIRRRAGLETCGQPEEVYEIVASSLRTLYPEDRTYLVAGSADASEKEKLAGELTKLMHGSTVRWTDDIVHTAKGRISLEGVDKVILAERFGNCSFAEMKAQYRVLDDLKIPAAGAVLYG